MSGEAPALALDDLVVSYDNVRLLRGISLEVPRGRTHALVGESGSGKTLAGRAALGLLRRPGPHVVSGDVRVDGTALGPMSERALRSLRGDAAGMVFQEPLSSLDPCFAVGTQLAEAIALHGGRVKRADLARRFEAVGIDRSRKRLRSPPHLLSGGQRQRVMISIAVANDPALLVADEPTTALDPVLQRQVLDLIDAAREARRMGVLLITHNIGIVVDRADWVSVLYSGTIVESGPASEVLSAPRHPYTAALLACRPHLAGPRTALSAIPGQMPSPEARPFGCAFRPRCGFATGACEEEPPLIDGVACWHTEALLRGLSTAAAAEPDWDRVAPPPKASGVPVLALSHVGKRHADGLVAVRDVSLTLDAGRTLGVVGRSGSGKTTLGRLMLRLTEPSTGQVVVEGRDLAGLGASALRRARRRMQMVFQDPRGSIDPRMAISAQIEQPMVVHGLGNRAERVAKVRRLIDLVGLPAALADRLPQRFSGGQLQRVAIARALATDPVLLVADEPVAALDLSIQAQVLDVFRTVQAEFDLAMVFVSHDLAVVRHVADEIAVMADGAIVEYGATDAVLSKPKHPATRALLESVPARSAQSVP